MTSQNNKKGPLSYLIMVLLLFSGLFHSNQAVSSQGVVPLKITVHGKLVISDASSDLSTPGGEALNLNLQLLPEPNSGVLSGKSSMRIRTNLSAWKLAAQRYDVSTASDVSPEDVQLAFHTSAGSKANLNAAKLIPPFNQASTLSNIASSKPTEILMGVSKTSVAKDPKNNDNWFQLTSVCKTSPTHISNGNEWSTVISYSLISP